MILTLGFQQTIPSMMRMREERCDSSKMSSGSAKVEVTRNRQHLVSSSPRVNPYKVPFQRMEPLYADPAPMLMPQAVHFSPAFGLGGFYTGTNSLFMPSIQQNVLEVPVIPYSKRAEYQKENSDCNNEGRTSSPRNQLEPVDNPKPVFKETKIDTPNSDPSVKDLESKNTNEFKMNVAPRNSGLRVLTGSIEKVIKWEQMWTNKKDIPLLFEVIAILKQNTLHPPSDHSFLEFGLYCIEFSQLIQELCAPLLQMHEGRNPNEKQLLLRERGGPVLSVMYYEIDRNIPSLSRGQYIRCVCRSLGKRRFQAFSVRTASQQEHSSLQRLSFLCHRAVQEALLSANEK